MLSYPQTGLGANANSAGDAVREDAFDVTRTPATYKCLGKPACTRFHHIHLAIAPVLFRSKKRDIDKAIATTLLRRWPSNSLQGTAMARYKFLVFSAPTEGRDEEYNLWYDTQHVPEILAVPGFVSAERGKVMSRDPFKPVRYYAAYEMETSNPYGAVAEMRRRISAGEMVRSDAVSTQAEVHLVELRDTISL